MGAVIPAIGIGLQGIGLIGQVTGASEQSRLAQEQLALQKQVEQQRQQAMELDASRRKMEIIRNQQRARSMALTVSNSQGASQGSGLAGAYGQISGVTGTNLTGVNENLQIGRNVFGFNSQITDVRSQMAENESQMAMWKGISGLGGSILNNQGFLNSQFNNLANRRTDVFNPWAP